MPKSVGPRKRSRSSSSNSRRETKGKDKELSAITKKQIDSLPEHAQRTYKKTHASSIEQYQNPEKRRGDKRQSRAGSSQSSLGCSKKAVQEKGKSMDKERRRRAIVVLYI
jgi:cation transport regulator ChaB